MPNQTLTQDIHLLAVVYIGSGRQKFSGVYHPAGSGRKTLLTSTEGEERNFIGYGIV